jgi:hypothetical protein
MVKVTTSSRQRSPAKQKCCSHLAGLLFWTRNETPRRLWQPGLCEKRRLLRRQPNDHNFGSLMLAVTAGAFLLVAWVATKGVILLLPGASQLSVGQSYRPSILATTKMSIAPPRPPPKSRYNKE